MTELATRTITDEMIERTDDMNHIGLTRSMISGSITFAYEVIDLIDGGLSPYGFKLADVVELAGFSSIMGDLITYSAVRESQGRFVRNVPHKYPDMVACPPNGNDIEIKVSLECNKPKGHLAKTGYYLTFRYVLGDVEGNFVKGKKNRKNVPWVWEARFGLLEKGDFNTSNTEGDSGKTANVNAKGMKKLKVVFRDRRFNP